MAQSELTDVARDETSGTERDVFPELAATLLSHTNKTERLIARMKYSVEQGDRMLTELGLEPTSAPIAAPDTDFETRVNKVTAAEVRLIDDWEASLKDADIPGTMGIVRDLAALKRALQADQPAREKIA